MTHRKPPSRLANAVAGLGAQVFSSLNSFLIIIISARFLELGVHGHFVFGVALCQIVLSLVRALCGETVVVLSTRGDDTTDVPPSARRLLLRRLGEWCACSPRYSGRNTVQR